MLEVGLGGRLDATNIVSIVSVIVSIDFDHEEQLGPTLTSIATEKAGIVQPEIPVVCGRLPAEALHGNSERMPKPESPGSSAATSKWRSPRRRRPT